MKFVGALLLLCLCGGCAVTGVEDVESETARRFLAENLRDLCLDGDTFTREDCACWATETEKHVTTEARHTALTGTLVYGDFTDPPRSQYWFWAAHYKETCPGWFASLIETPRATESLRNGLTRSCMRSGRPYGLCACSADWVVRHVDPIDKFGLYYANHDSAFARESGNNRIFREIGARSLDACESA